MRAGALLTRAPLDLICGRGFNRGMVMSGAAIGLILMNLPVLIGQWVGLIAMRGCGRNPGWWCLMAGTVISTLGFLSGLFGLLLAFTPLGGSGNLNMVLYFGLSGLGILGSMVFAAGFAVHGIGRRRERDRVAELEMVIAAQNEQLADQR